MRGVTKSPRGVQSKQLLWQGAGTTLTRKHLVQREEPAAGAWSETSL